MKRLAIPPLLLATLLAPRAEAQPCAFAAQFTGYGAACSASGALPSTLTGLFASGSNGCTVSVTIDPPFLCCNVYVFGRFLVLGFQSASIPMPNGCTLLAFPDLILPFPVDSDTLAHAVPNDPAIVGLDVFVQGIVRRFDTIAFVDFFDFTAGLQISFL
ncbi:MAG TPA: hypothetical protein VFI25_19195 [Planctomycetota bacterium]|jgi:hypothetical protein|nr:hypothetical protein [Planctomycetota bacterium]